MATLTDGLWSSVAKHLVLPAGDLLTKQGMLKHLRFLKKAQWWSRDQVLDYQTRAFRSLVQTAYSEVPLYRELMEVRGITPEQVRDLSDIKKLPIITKEILRKNYPHKTIRNTGQKNYEVSSSGSTGTNLYIREDLETTGHLRACHMLALDWAGWSVGDPHVQFGMTLKRGVVKGAKDFVLRCHYVSSFELTDGELDKVIARIEKYKIKHVHGYPGSLYHLARRSLERQKILPMKSVMSWGDNLYRHYRETIEKAFQQRVFDSYGCAEGITVGAQCGAGNRYHTYSTDALVEFTREDGSEVPANEPGNLLLTRLHPGAMPLIRYQVGDLGVRGPDTPCSCGRGFLTLESIQGRDTDIIVTPGGNRLIVHFFTGLLEFFPEISQFQIRQKRKDLMVISIVPHSTFTKTIEENIVNTLRAKGADISMKVELVESIPAQSSGKRRFVINEVSAVQ